MRILQVNKFLYRRAGAEAYMLDLAELLARHGQEVGMWGTSERLQEVTGDYRKLQEVTVFEDFLVDSLNFDQREGIWRDLKKFGHMLWSAEAARKFEGVLKEFKPEVVHLHNIYHHISPSILPVAARYGVPVVATVHDWHLINPNYSLYDHGEICERGGLRAVAHRCIKNSYAASFADVLEWRLHRMLRVYERQVAKFIVPNEFVKGKLVENGVEKGKIEAVKLFVSPSPGLRPPSPLGRGEGEGYILFSGRLTVEKGIYLLLDIAKQLPEIQFKIAGTGPELSGVRCQVSGVRNVELLGFLAKENLPKVIAGARLIIVPSLWYDLSPFSVLEAMVAGKAVAASRIGGIPELIEDGKTGFLIDPPGPIRPIVDKIKKLYYDEKLLNRVGKAAKEYVAREHNPQAHYEKIMEIYSKISNSPNF